MRECVCSQSWRLCDIRWSSFDRCHVLTLDGVWARCGLAAPSSSMTAENGGNQCLWSVARCCVSKQSCLHAVSWTRLLVKNDGKVKDNVRKSKKVQHKIYVRRLYGGAHGQSVLTEVEVKWRSVCRCPLVQSSLSCLAAQCPECPKVFLSCVTTPRGLKANGNLEWNIHSFYHFHGCYPIVR